MGVWEGDRMTGILDPDAGTREKILRLIIERGPITSAELATELVLTAAAVRRHLAQLEVDGQIAEYEGVVVKPARRGRPSRRYVATGEGQAIFGDSYGDVATQALDFVKAAFVAAIRNRMAHIHIDRAGTVRQLVFSDDQPPGDDRDF